MIEEAEQPGMSISAVARKYGIHPNQLFHWRKLMHAGALSAMRADEEVVPISEVKSWFIGDGDEFVDLSGLWPDIASTSSKT